MNTENETIPMTRAERETETAATRLEELVNHALVMVAVRSARGVDDLDSSADRIERAARDLSVALRELAYERKQREEENETR
ncbi:MAG: hypothetical protein ABIP75_07550 [Pyrinomonadaceae bacterium]